MSGPIFVQGKTAGLLRKPTWLMLGVSDKERHSGFFCVI